MSNDRREKIRRLSRAVRPALLEVACEPELLMAMVLANLMSPALWDFRDRISRRLAGKAVEPPVSHERIVMKEIHDYMNKHLFHGSPSDIEGIWGNLDLEEERNRLGAREVDYAMNTILAAVEERRKRGILSEKQSVLISLIGNGKFPDYEYSTIDLIRAHRRHLRRKKHKPIGITCCADEAVLSASLAWAEGHVPLERIMIFGSAPHYCTLAHHHGHGYWFNGKQEYFDVESWARLCNPGELADIREVFLERVQGFDRMISMCGVHRFDTNESTFSPDRLAQTHDTFRRFFGAEPSQLADVRKGDIRFLSNPMGKVSLLSLNEVTDAASAREILQGFGREHPDSSLELAHYAFRDLWVAHPSAYLEAAARGHLVRQRAAGIGSLTDALNIVRGLEGEESIFNDLDRITLPDEVLLFGTGTHRDKAILLYTLLRLSTLPNQAEKEAMELIFTKANSYVSVGNTYISTTNYLERTEIGEPELLRVREDPTGTQ